MEEIFAHWTLLRFWVVTLRGGLTSVPRRIRCDTGLGTVGAMSRLRTLSLALWAALLCISWTVSAAAPAHADDDETPKSWRITRYHVTATPGKENGSTKVIVDLDFDFSRDAGHGPFIVLPTRMRSPNPDQWRMLDTDIQDVTSSTGANTEQMVKSESGNLVLRIGRKGTKFTGVQNYRVTYTVHGILYPDHPESKMDEFNWNAVGNGWQVPMSNIKVTLNSPALPRKTACFYGSKFTNTCSAPAPARSMVWTLDHLGKEQGLQVVAGFPAGTFEDADFRTTKRYHMGNMFPVNAPSVGGAALVGAASIGGVLAMSRRGRDRAWAGLAPGMVPLSGDAPTTTRRKATTAVAFRPPKGARPGEIGTLIDEKADLKDVTATIVDLSVRGHLTMEQIDSKNQRLTLTGRAPDELAPYEKNLVEELFGSGTSITTKDLKSKSRGKALPKCQEELYERVSTPPLSWFRSNPNTTRTLAAVGGVMLTLLGIGLCIAFGFLGYGLIPLGVVAAGVLLAVLSGTFPARTPAGSAVLAEAEGFRLYLTTAEADQIRFEEGIDVFSRYLPYAIVFGVAERWSKIFEKLAAEGRYTPDTSWYVGNYGYGMGYGFASSFDSFTSSMESAIQASTAAANSSSSGGSGFSGGGGAGGGGGGGW